MNKPNIKLAVFTEYANIEKQIIYAESDTDCMCEQRDRDIMKKVTCGRDYFKFNPDGIEGAERIKNYEHLWFDLDNNIWLVCCGCVSDMHGTKIPNAWNISKVGEWYEEHSELMY